MHDDISILYQGRIENACSIQIYNNHRGIDCTNKCKVYLYIDQVQAVAQLQPEEKSTHTQFIISGNTSLTALTESTSYFLKCKKAAKPANLEVPPCKGEHSSGNFLL